MVDEGDEIPAHVGERVLDPGRHLGVALARDDARLLQSLEPFGERLGTDAGERTLQGAEAIDAFGEIAQDEERPLA